MQQTEHINLSKLVSGETKLKKNPDDFELKPTLLTQILENAKFSILAKRFHSLSGDVAGLELEQYK